MTFSTDEQFALQLDSEDPLRRFREKFHLPLGKDGKPLIYFAGNSLGLMPKAAQAIVEEELDNWAKLGVDAHHATGTPWYTYHEALREPTARLVGAKPVEVICMNSLTVNLHLMMATFYRPTKSRFKILMEEPAFPSDTYAIKTQIAHHGLDPRDALILARPRKGEFTIRTEDICRSDREARRSTRGGADCRCEFFHGSIVRYRENHCRGTDTRHRRWVRSCPCHRQRAADIARLECRFRCLVFVQISKRRARRGRGRVRARTSRDQHEIAAARRLVRQRSEHAVPICIWNPNLFPVPSADGWQISNPPIFSMAPLRASLAIFDEAGGMEPLRAKSIRLTGYLEFLLTEIGSKRFTVITPRDPNERGCQLSILAHEHPKELFKELEAAGVKCDFREPNVIRVAPTPLYNTFHEVWRFARILAQHR